MLLDNLDSTEKTFELRTSSVSRDEFDVYCCDPYWIEKLDKITTAYHESSLGAKRYKITVSDFIKLFNLKEQKNAKSKEARKSSRFTTINKDDSSIEE